MADVHDVELTPLPSPNVDLTPLTTAITKVAEDVVRTIAQDMVPYLLTQQVEESLKKLAPGLIQTAVSEEKVLLKETAQETAREALPDLLRTMPEHTPLPSTLIFPSFPLRVRIAPCGKSIRPQAG